MRGLLFISAMMTAGLCAGCVERTITITSEPPGALVWLNDREVGRTPVDVDFVYYGTYDVRLEKDGHEPLLTRGEASPPWWDNIPFDFAAELAPLDLHADVKWHYALEPARDDRAALIERAGALRGRVQPEPTTAPATQPADKTAPDAATQPSADDEPEPPTDALR